MTYGKLGVLVCACNFSIQEEPGGWGFQSHLYSKFESHLEDPDPHSLSPHPKGKEKKTLENEE